MAAAMPIALIRVNVIATHVQKKSRPSEIFLAMPAHKGSFGTVRSVAILFDLFSGYGFSIESGAYAQDAQPE